MSDKHDVLVEGWVTPEGLAVILQKIGWDVVNHGERHFLIYNNKSKIVGWEVTDGSINAVKKKNSDPLVSFDLKKCSIRHFDNDAILIRCGDAYIIFSSFDPKI